ncbi:hypothetical protein RHGRI_031471 [Rhododendron griersonianum]|nr:hypothetical protein RHGRI_031471 [Rhododendron griersonianum]
MTNGMTRCRWSSTVESSSYAPPLYTAVPSLYRCSISTSPISAAAVAVEVSDDEGRQRRRGAYRRRRDGRCWRQS